MLRRRNSAEGATSLELRNLVFNAFEPAIQDFLRDRLVTKNMLVGEILYEEGKPITHIMFPHSGVVSLQATMHDGRTVERTSVGLEGFLGFNHILGEPKFPCQAVVQISGHASWLSLSEFEQAISQFEGIRPILLRYTMSHIQRIMQAVACASSHTATQRIACWLLHANDRTLGSNFELTQLALSNVLSLRRATVSEACSHLQSLGSLSYSRGMLSIVDRDILEDLACECYRAVHKISLQS